MSVSRKSRLTRSHTPDLPDLELPSCSRPVSTAKPALADKSKRTAPEKHKTHPIPVQTDLFAHPLPPLPRQHLNAQDVRLAYVPHGTLNHPQPNASQWLYHVTTPDTAASYFDHGIALSRKAPLLVTEAAGISTWLATLHSDSTDAPEQTQFCVLRLYRKMVSELLEPDADHTTHFQAPCFWLTTAPPV
ncbi:hypothetical protein [Acetobacter cibinongensis]|uniref:Uncharacterized protein n=1 Tax=Acetobacter cibinongensis TaxID=146475 RepID=A0A1Z5YWS0_9PROT|nr:hypothetical protein [Acetobacter cibinongensis]OUJ03624.1 hypothetical protein HK14_01465 [Acetobacter cibinongensis]